MVHQKDALMPMQMMIPLLRTYVMACSYARTLELVTSIACAPPLVILTTSDVIS